MKRCSIVVRGHHERYDGGGYPDQLKGNDINIFTAIVAGSRTPFMP